jgi:hypothetical protein
MRARFVLLCAALALASCGPPAAEPSVDVPSEAPAAPAAPDAPAVDAALLGAPNSEFAAVEPTELGVIGAPTVDEAISPLTADTHAESGTLQVSIQESGDNAVADVVRLGLGDDSVAGAHLRIEFRREPDGWYPTNAYRRFQCVRGALAGQWSVGPCP